MNLKALWREPSTKRGAVMLITGGAVLYQAVFGSGEIDVAGMESRIERWIGIGMMMAGLLGWLPDAPREKSNESRPSDQAPQLPKIELMGRSEPDPPPRNPNAPDVPRYRRTRDPDDDGVQSPSMSPVRSDENGWNG